MSDELEKRLEHKIGARLRRSRHDALRASFDGSKVANEVLDRPALMTIYRLINSHVIARVNGAVKAGKESVVFLATDWKGQNVALKVYLVATASFKRRWPYLLGDRRFGRVRRGTRNMVNAWARKEYRNLLQCAAAGVPVPRPRSVSGSVLAMDFVGEGGSPAKTLLESQVSMNDYHEAMELLWRMHRRARLVHGDYSEYNIFKTDRGLVVFDLGSAVESTHANAALFLRRDVVNITKFFAKRGLEVPDPDDAYLEVIE